ncbi:MAG: winged helix DNA-binding domain-containing protein [Chloroflexota bacterium]
MTTSTALKRLAQQRLTANPLATPGEVVGWLGAVQAQDYYGAKWSLGLRMQNPTDDLIDQAFDEGAILRTHVMRPTWHLVTPDDIRWMLALTAARVKAANAYMCRQLELDEALFARSSPAIAGALEGGQCLTRAELGAKLAEAGIKAEGNRLNYVMMQAELDGVICSGPRRGRQHSYALLEERAPQARTLARDEALAELARRYFTGHGPATVHDFSWWSGLTVADAKTGVEMAAAHLAQEEIDGETHWLSEEIAASEAALEAKPAPQALLLPTYDEFLVGYTAYDAARRAGREEVAFNSALAIDGQIAGSWRRTLKRGTAVVELAPFEPLTDAQAEAVGDAARRYGEFLGLNVVLS